MRVDTAAEVAAVMDAKWSLGIEGGLVVANPIPVEDEIPADEIGAIIEQALGDMDALGIHGKDATPYLLGRIVEITGGVSLTANIAWSGTTPGSAPRSLASSLRSEVSGGRHQAPARCQRTTSDPNVET